MMETKLDHQMVELDRAFVELRNALEQRDEIFGRLDHSMQSLDRNFRKFHNSLGRIKLDITRLGNKQRDLIDILDQ